MAEDDDDKTRRNLVAFSAVAIFSAYLELPLAQVWTRLLGTDLKLDPSRVCGAALLLLGYLLLRYVFSEDGQHSTHQFAVQAHRRYIAATEKHARRAVTAAWKADAEQALSVCPPEGPQA